MSSELCMGCMNKKGNTAVCPRCGYDENTARVLPAMKPGTILDGRYIVGAAGRVNGEGVTYIAMDRETGRRVTLREFLPQTVAFRGKKSDAVNIRENCEHIYQDYLSDFLEISKAVSRLADIHAIVPVIDIFEANNTAYAVYEFVNGRSLGELIQRAQRLTWEEAKPLFLSLISAMEAAHSVGLVHFGLSPESVKINREGNLVITDFGIPDARMAETELRPELNEGFSALEQYSIEGKKGRWTDVYSMSALMLFALTGKRPPSAQVRATNPKLNVSSSLADTIPTHVLTAIAGGLQVESSNRIPSMEKLKAELTMRSDAPVEEPVRGTQSVRSALGNAVGAVGNFASNLVSQRRNASQQRKEEKENTRKAAQVSDEETREPWYRRLNQFQYGLLSACISIIALGIIAIIVFLNVRDSLGLSTPQGSTVYYHQYVSESDMAGTAENAVPNLRGVTLTDATNLPEYLQFEIIQIGESYSDDYDVGVIISQNIPANTMVSSNTPIGVTVSLGSQTCKIPEITNMTVAQADTALTEAGLRLGKQSEEYSDSVPAGHIIGIEGASIGSRLTRGSAVNVIVSLGAE